MNANELAQGSEEILIRLRNANMRLVEINNVLFGPRPIQDSKVETQDMPCGFSNIQEMRHFQISDAINSVRANLDLLETFFAPSPPTENQTEIPTTIFYTRR